MSETLLTPPLPARSGLSLCRIGERHLSSAEVFALWELLPSGTAPPVEPPASVEAAISAFRYRHGLISGDECVRWLAARGLRYAELQGSLTRQWRGPQPTTPAQREADLLLDPSWPTRVRELAARVAVASPVPDHALTPADWPSLQASYVQWCATACSIRAREQRLAQDRLPWLLLQVAWIEFDSVDAAREGWCCAALDGMPIAELAASAGLPQGQTLARLHALPPTWSAALLRVAPGAVCEPVQDRGRWWVLALIAVTEPSLAEAEVRAGIDAGLIADAVDLLLTERVRWLL